MNVANAVQALVGLGSGQRLRELATAEAEACFAAAGLEVASIEEDAANREGRMELTDIPGLTRGGGSSWQSLVRGTGSIEADYLNGEICLLGRLHGVPTPVNALLQRRANAAAAAGLAPGIDDRRGAAGRARRTGDLPDHADAARYDRRMATLVLTLIGDDRAGLVNAVAEVVARHGGNWERSQMAELAGKFAGIVLVTVPDDCVDALVAALEPLHGMLDITAQPGAVELEVIAPGARRFALDLVGTDRPGIVREITDVLAAHAVNIDTLRTETRDAPMSGGRLFEAAAMLEVPASTDIGALRVALEKLANELMVDITLDTGCLTCRDSGTRSSRAPPARSDRRSSPASAAPASRSSPSPARGRTSNGSRAATRGSCRSPPTSPTTPPPRRSPPPSTAAFASSCTPPVCRRAARWRRSRRRDHARHRRQDRRALRLLRAVEPHLGNGSRIAVLGGHYGYEPSPAAPLAGMVNAALSNLMRALADHWGRRGVTVHLIAPGRSSHRACRRSPSAPPSGAAAARPPTTCSTSTAPARRSDG